MSYVDSSLDRAPSPLSGLSGADAPLSGADLLNDDPEEQEEEREPAEPPAKDGTLKERLLAQIDDINLARYIDETTLNEIGERVTREFRIDETSRADWADKAEKAMDFALQKTEEKQYPWPRACYSLDTDVLTRQGWRPVADLRVGDAVLSRAPDGTADYHPVTRTFLHHADEVVHFEGKSIDLLVTPNHRMLVEDRYTGAASFIEAGVFVGSSKRTPYSERLADKAIPLTSRMAGNSPERIYGIPARAYVRLLGWFISEGASIYGRNRHVNKAGETVDYGLSGSSFSIAQDRLANPTKYEQIRTDIEACGFTYKAYERFFIVHAKSMPAMLKAELRGLGRVYDKHIPRHALELAPHLLEQLLDTLVAGDGHVRRRAHQSQTHRVYHTTSRLLADNVQELCQRIGLRGTIAVTEARAGGVINGRAIMGAVPGYVVSINTKPTCQVMKLKRQLEPYGGDVACVEVEPHHTLYVRRNGKAVWCGNSNVIFPLIGQASISFAARTYPAMIQSRSVVKGVVWGSDKGTPVMENGRPKLKAPPPMPVQSGPPPGGPGAQMTPGAAPPVMAGAMQQGGPPMQQGGPAPQPGPPPGPPQGPPEIEWLLAPGEKRLRADRVGEHMSHQLLVEMPYWEPQTDQLLHQLPIIGGAIRKTYRDLVEEKNASMFVSLMNLVWDYNAPSFEAAPRHTEKMMLYPHEILEMERAGAGDMEGTDEGAFIHYDYGMAGGGNVAYGFNRTTDSGDQSDPDKPHLFLEQHRRLDLDGDGYPEPYAITVHERSAKVVRIVARYDREGVKASPDGETILRVQAVDHYTLYPFLPSLDGGSYPVGFGHLLRPLNEAINTSLNQMFDAGHLQNSGAGFIASGMGMASGMVGLQVGKFQRVDTKGASIKDSVLPIPFPGPSTVLFQLLGVLMSAGKEIASIQDVLAGDAGIANAPPTTVLALIEQGLKVYTAIIKRVFRAEKCELDKLFRLNRLYLREKTSYRVGDEERDIEPSDYRIGGGVEPIADPTMVTDMQKLGRAQLLYQLRTDPLMDGKKILERYLDAAMIDRPDDLFAQDQMAGVMQQLALAKAQAELGRERAAEAKDQTQAFLNLALARKNATAQEEVFIQAQMDFLRYHIEALNAATRAAQVDHSIHRTNLEHQRGQMQHALDAADMLIRAHQGDGGLPPGMQPQLQPDAQGTFPVAPEAPPGPAAPALGPTSGAPAGAP